MALHIYIPQDRLRALVRGETLPDRTRGAALFADISGFTALAELLRDALGPRRGAEELTRQIEAVYSTLITQIELFGGSVIDFAGDSMLCWFDDDLSRVAEIGLREAINQPSGPQRAVVCGMTLQRAMRAFARIVLPDQSTTSLALKVSIASGSARRFVVGDETIQRLDTLAGATVTRTAIGEHLATKGEVLVDEATVQLLGDSLSIIEWRVDEDGKRFAVLEKLSSADEQLSVTRAPDVPIPDHSMLRLFIHRAVYEREASEQGYFLTEFRPCVALFVRFTGIDYDLDSAESELDMFIREAQGIASKHGGTLLDTTIGDKGSYIYINFGALSAHEEDARRAVKTARELMKATSLDLQIGITQGLMRVGAYGGETRKVFGALGDDVNLAARLMATALVGEILLSSHVYKAVMNQFSFEPRPPLSMKGKAEPLPVFAVTGELQQRAIRLQEPTYALPMVGREKELGIINDKLDLAAKGKGQIIAIVAEAGLGKSRLVAEVIRSARRKGFVGYGGACQSDGIHTPYLAWKSIWGAFFNVDPDMLLRKQMRNIEDEIQDRAPDRLGAIPLLNAVLDLNIPENDFTKNLEPKIRQSALHALLEDCLKSAAKEEPILIVIEDLQWIDALSNDLLEGLAKALENYAACFVLAYRLPQMERLHDSAPRFEALTQFTRVELHELTQAEAESAIRAKLVQLYPARGSALPNGLVDVLMARAQGNPFYLEELLNFVRDRGLDPSDLNSIELPDSLHTLIMSRIDQLSEQEKTTLRVASIVGRLFRARWLTGYYPELGPMPQVKAALDELDALDITPLDSEPELSYLFKHIITHEVTYENLPFATRARLHERLAMFLESIVAAEYASPLLDTITFHYLRSENQEKQREYLRKAGEAAQKDYANDGALEYYRKLLSLLDDGKEKIEIYLKRGQVLELISKFKESEQDYRMALEMAENDPIQQASAKVALGKLCRNQGDYVTSLEWLRQAKEEFTKLEDTSGLTRTLIEIGGTLWGKGEYARAIEPLTEGLALAREAGDKSQTARALGNLGVCAIFQSDYIKAQELCEESLKLNREVLGKWGAAQSLNNLGVIALDQGDYVTARAYIEEFLSLRRDMGDKTGIRTALINLSNVAVALNDLGKARALCEESLNLAREVDDKMGIWTSLGNLGNVALAEGDYATARTLFNESLSMCQEMDDKTRMGYALIGLGLVELAENNPQAQELIINSLHLRQGTGEQVAQASSLLAFAGLVLKDGRAQFAAQLLGAVESALKELHAVIEPEMLRFHAQTLAAAREQLGEAAFQSAWQEGGRWSLEEAVRKALAE